MDTKTTTQTPTDGHSAFTKKTSGVLVTILIGIIIVSFMFSGYESLRGGPDIVAKVGDHNIRYKEYQVEFERQMQFYSQMFGGQPLTNAQIEALNIKDAVLRNLINRKLIMVFADRMGIAPSADQIKKEIKELPYFKTNNQFDVEKYKLVLTNARLNPAEFENDIAEQIKGQMAQGTLRDYPVSTALVNDIMSFKKDVVKATIIQIRKEGLKSKIAINDKEVSDFLKDSKNMGRVENLFKSRKDQLDRKEEVKARHILLTTEGKKEQDVVKEINDIRKKLTTKNFVEMANKFTQDPSGKENGGDLGQFGKGRMVPEFDQVAFSLKPGEISAPVKTQFGYHLIWVEKHFDAKIATLAEHQSSIATELIRDTKHKELDELNKDLSERVKSLLAQDKMVEIEKLQKEYGFTLEKEVSINQIDGVGKQIALDQSQLKDLITDLNNVKHFSLPSMTTVAKAKKPTEKDVVKLDEAKEVENLKLSYARKVSEDILEKLKNDSKVKVFNILN